MNGLYAYWLGRIPDLTNGMKRKLISAFGTSEEVFHAGRKQIASVIGEEKADAVFSSGNRMDPFDEHDRIVSEYRSFSSAGMNYFTIGHPRYPERLKEIAQAPYGFWLIGRLPEEAGLVVAMIGSREPTPYGRKIAEEIAGMLASGNVPVISGMARGIDSISQKAVLDAGGSSLAVLGCGADICYPREVQALYERLKWEGGILSEYPPGTEPKRSFFPARNRIISGLADVTVVIEAGKKSGSLITAGMALEQGRDVYAVPGRCGDTMSEGCNRLIHDGAGMILSAADLMEELHLSHVHTVPLSQNCKRTLAPKEDMVYSCLDLYAKSLNVLEVETHLEITELLRILTILEIEGCASRTAQGHFIRLE